ncbi:hypothetical protein S0112_004 [Shewanella phage S0112]|nr:hypothetical protein S0112_004 [Shewanella phage S0112]
MLSDEVRTELVDSLIQIKDWAQQKDEKGEPVSGAEMVSVVTQLNTWIKEIPRPKFCTMCNFWDGENEQCSKYEMAPPASVILNGCDDFDDIPF